MLDWALNVGNAYSGEKKDGKKIISVNKVYDISHYQPI